VNADEAIVRTPFMEVYTGPGRGYPVFFVVEKGEEFKFQNQKNDWFKVQSRDGLFGWINYKDFAFATSKQIPNARQQIIDSKWTVGILAGLFGKDNSYSAEAGYYLFPSLVLNAKISKITGDFSSSSILSSQVQFQGFRHSMFSPYIGAGFGLMEYSPRKSLVNANQSRENVFNYGAGLNMHVYKRLLIRLAVNNNLLQNAKSNHLEWQIGIYSSFR